MLRGLCIKGQPRIKPESWMSTGFVTSMSSLLRATLLFFAVMVIADVGPVLMRSSLWGEAHSVLNDLFRYVGREMTWTNKIVGTLLFGIVYYFLVKPPRAA